MQRFLLFALLVVTVVGVSGCYAPGRGYYYHPSRVVVVHERHYRR
jgi:hypothetical protein